MNIIQKILKDTNYHLDLFSSEEIESLNQKATTKVTQGKEAYFTRCVVGKKDVKLTPEEIVRQLYAERLIKIYRYPIKRLRFEHKVTFGSEKKKADIAVLDETNNPDTPYIIVELKRPKLKTGKEQLRSYCNATGAIIGIWTNGGQISYYHRKDPNYFEDITDIPKATQELKDIFKERFTLKQLVIKDIEDRILHERKSLKDIILEMEDEVLANAGVDVFEEVFKLIFTKLYDEYLSQEDKAIINYHVQPVTGTIVSESVPGYLGGKDPLSLKTAVSGVDDTNFRPMEFRNTGQTDAKLKRKFKTYSIRPRTSGQAYFLKSQNLSFLTVIWPSAFPVYRTSNYLTPIWWWWMRPLNT